MGGCFTKGEVVFVDWVSLLVSFSYFFLLFVTFHKLLFTGLGGPGEAFY